MSLLSIFVSKYKTTLKNKICKSGLYRDVTRLFSPVNNRYRDHPHRWSITRLKLGRARWQKRRNPSRQGHLVGSSFSRTQALTFGLEAFSWFNDKPRSPSCSSLKSFHKEYPSFHPVRESTFPPPLPLSLVSLLSLVLLILNFTPCVSISSFFLPSLHRFPRTTDFPHPLCPSCFVISQFGGTCATNEARFECSVWGCWSSSSVRDKLV